MPRREGDWHRLSTDVLVRCTREKPGSLPQRGKTLIDIPSQ